MSDKFKIEATQFLRPNGEQRTLLGMVSVECRLGYEVMRKAGCRLTMEELMSGQVSVCIEEPELGDYNIRIVSNGPEVTRAVEAMLKGFDAKAFEAWKLEMLTYDNE